MKSGTLLRQVLNKISELKQELADALGGKS